MNMSRPTFCLQGIGGLYNYGCEAIVRGTLRILRQEWPGCKVLYVSPRPDSDALIVKDTDLAVIPRLRSTPFSIRFFKGVARRLGLSWRLPGPEPYYWTEGADCVLSIGGDIFTLLPHEASASVFPVVENARRILDQGVPLVLWGASVGPFESNPAAVQPFLDVLSGMSLITAREPVTLEYLRQHHLEANVEPVADPAYLMLPDDSQTAMHDLGRPTIAINLSPLSTSYAVGERQADSLMMAQSHMLARMVEEYDRDLLLVPHVICPWNPMDDDHGYLTELYALLSRATQARVRLLPPDLGARRTKAIIGKCEALLAARMHCAIAGVSMGVPTLFLSYSAKAVGMCQYIYGSRDWVMAVDSQPERILEAVGKLLAQKEDLRSRLQQRLPLVQTEALAAGRYLREMLESTATC